MGMVVGLSLARLLTGLAGFVQHPKKERIYPLHIGWVAFLFLMLVHFWWWEHRLSATSHVLGFGAFLFLILFCSLFYFLCVLLFPTDMKEYKGYEDYFFSRKSWFFAFLAALFVTDIGDTLLKGRTTSPRWAQNISSAPLFTSFCSHWRLSSATDAFTGFSSFSP